MIDYQEIFLRMLVSLLIGCIIGLDRNLRGKPTGMKTLGLVAMGASLVTMASSSFMFKNDSASADAMGKAIQGVVTGIGFLGAGVIVHDRVSDQVRGLTTAASIWVTAAVGIVCGTGQWKIAVMALSLVLVLFILGRPLERYLHRRWLHKKHKHLHSKSEEQIDLE